MSAFYYPALMQKGIELWSSNDCVWKDMHTDTMYTVECIVQSILGFNLQIAWMNSTIIIL